MRGRKATKVYPRVRRLGFHLLLSGVEAAACVFALRRSDRASEDAVARDLRRKEALELNDRIVQGLVVARASFELGDRAGGMKALDATLARAKHLVSDLLGEEERANGSHGSLVREDAAAVTQL